jgi:hypothetical protein
MYVTSGLLPAEAGEHMDSILVLYLGLLHYDFVRYIVHHYTWYGSCRNAGAAIPSTMYIHTSACIGVESLLDDAMMPDAGQPPLLYVPIHIDTPGLPLCQIQPGARISKAYNICRGCFDIPARSRVACAVPICHWSGKECEVGIKGCAAIAQVSVSLKLRLGERVINPERGRSFFHPTRALP